MAPYVRLSREERRYCQSQTVPSVWRTICAALFDHGLILLAAALTLVALRWQGPPAALVAYIIGLPVVLRSMRGLECLVHEASHFNWLRRQKRLNDVLANLLAAIPLLSTVENYRSSHEGHHKLFNTEMDIDKIRHREHEFASLNRKDIFKLTHGIAIRYGRYLPGWWIAIGTQGETLTKFIAWHAIVLILPLAFIFGPVSGVASWIALWFVPFFFFLPLLRMVGEAGEHDYSRAGGPYALTYTNRSLFHRFVLHPHNDGYHTLHHMFPWIPHFKLERAHLEMGKRFPKHWAKVPLERR